jgi:hypothetical protein
MTFDEFKNELDKNDIYSIVRKYILSGNSTCFAGDPQKLLMLKEAVSAELKLNIKCVETVGSAKLGFSLNPFKLGDVFNNKSDIDLLIVSNEFFDQAWKELLKIDFNYHQLSKKERDYLKESYQTVHRGYISPDKFPLKSEFARTWWKIFTDLSNKEEYEFRKIRGRLFKDWDFAEKYYSIQLVELLKVKHEN